MAKKKIELPKEVAEKYELVGWGGSLKQRFGRRFGLVNLRTMTIEQADRLYQKGFRKLKKKAAPKKEKVPAQS